jgi:hypothetical protein
LAVSEHTSIWRTAAPSHIRREAQDEAFEPRWPRWKVTLAVVVFCAAFWSGIGYIATRLLG